MSTTEEIARGVHDMYSELLNLCGFEPEEIEKETPRIDKAFRILEIEPEDIDQARKRVAEFFDIELLGIRKALGIWLKELVDMVLAKEEGKKIVYASMPPAYQMVAAMASASEDVYCVIPEVVLGTVMNCVFAKINPVLETAEKHGLAPGLAFCSYLKTRLGAITKGIIPTPDLVVPSCQICDQSPKVDELLHELYGVPVAYTDHILDSGRDQWPDVLSPQRVQYYAGEMSNTIEKFSEMFGYQVTEAGVRQAIDREAKLFGAAMEIWELMEAEPMPLSLKDLSLATRISSACSRTALREGIEVLHILRKELERRIENGVGVLGKGAPRVMATMVPYDPAIQGMFEELGLTVPITSLVPTPMKSAQSSYASVWEEVAYSIMRRRGENYTGSAHILQVKELAKLHNVDGAIVFHHIGCRQYNTWVPKAKEVLEQELDVPVLTLEGDFCDSREYNAEQMRTRLETFAQVVKNAKADKKGTSQRHIT